MNDATERPAAHIHIGGIFASAQGEVVRTVLGSCISVCLRDPVALIGGMNHFMLPGTSDKGCETRYGVHAMEVLINSCMALGADRKRMVAKVFGGGHVLKMKENYNNPPQSNMRFAIEFLHKENIPILSRDLGGYLAREVYFHTDTGKVLLKRLGGHSAESTISVLCTLEEERLKETSKLAIIEESNVTLF